MGLHDKIRVIDDPELSAEWAAQFERLAGLPWPPKDDAEWTLVLVRAGFTDEQIDQFFAESLPSRAVSTPGGQGPTFSMRLVEGLARREAGRPLKTDDFQTPTGGFFPAELCKLLDVSDDTLRSYAIASRVDRPGRGRSDFGYSLEATGRICRWIIDNPTSTYTTDLAKKLSLQMRNNSENPN